MQIHKCPTHDAWNSTLGGENYPWGSMRLKPFVLFIALQPCVTACSPQSSRNIRVRHLFDRGSIPGRERKVPLCPRERQIVETTRLSALFGICKRVARRGSLLGNSAPLVKLLADGCERVGAWRLRWTPQHERLLLSRVGLGSEGLKMIVSLTGGVRGGQPGEAVLWQLPPTHPA